MLHPLKFLPIYQYRIWGGDQLKTQFGRNLPSDSIGESWEIAAHSNCLTVVDTGPLTGRTIPQLTRAYSASFLGTEAPESAYEKFPYLVKLLAAKEYLSVQVHPDDSYGLKNGGELGKHEAWYVLAAAPGAEILCGLKPGTTKEVFQEALQDRAVEDCLQRIPVHAGDFIQIPPGLIHSLGAGIIVAEIQQNSDAVYRVYDFNRLEKNGQPRPLHIAQALEVIRFDDFSPVCQRPSRDCTLVAGEIFTIDFCSHRGTGSYAMDGTRFHILTNVNGRGEVQYRDYALSWDAGESLLIPAGIEGFTLRGDLDYLRTCFG
jgi:mannose-6-phosphate isomerase